MQTGVEVKLIGEDSNAFAIIGKVSKALRRAGLSEEVSKYQAAAMKCDNYDKLLRLTMETVEVL